jgi:hypothetical protein
LEVAILEIVENGISRIIDTLQERVRIHKAIGCFYPPIVVIVIIHMTIKTIPGLPKDKSA